ncbi:MAG: hypothetical protein RLZZ556_484, partial [Actinomycetota bacterium]
MLTDTKKIVPRMAAVGLSSGGASGPL